MLIDELKRAIEKSGKSQNQIARDCGINQANLSAFLSGKRSMSLETAEKVAKYLGLRLR